MVACRRPKEVKSTYDFTHCIQGLYNRKTLWRHIRTCPQNPKNENRTIGQKRVQSINSLTLPPPVDVSKSLWTIACEMVNDEVSNVVRNDQYKINMTVKRVTDPFAFDYLCNWLFLP